MSGEKTQRGTLKFLLDNSVFLIAGALAALVWVNLDKEAYHHVMDMAFAGEGDHAVTPHFIINDILMAFFFAIAGKEVWEALLPGGPLSNMRKAATPLIATLGGMVGPAGLYLLGCHWTGNMESLGDGWAVPMATDIAFSYLVARLIFGGDATPLQYSFTFVCL